MTIRRKLIARIRAAFGEINRLFALGAPNGRTIVNERCNDRAQWHRWYQADQRHKRQLRALRRHRYRVPHETWNLPRWAVK